MSDYITQNDLEDRIGADELVLLADHDGDGLADAVVVQHAIEDAEAVIDSHLCARFSVPVSARGQAPPAVRTRAINMALYFLHLRRDSVTENVRRQYLMDLEWLGRAADGQVTLGVEPHPAEANAATGVRHSGERRIFGRGEPL